jgi:hypothetical protein
MYFLNYVCIYYYLNNHFLLTRSVAIFLALTLLRLLLVSNLLALSAVVGFTKEFDCFSVFNTFAVLAGVLLGFLLFCVGLIDDDFSADFESFALL